MSAVPHHPHLEKHLEVVRTSHGETAAKAIAERCGLSGRPGADRETSCAKYLDAVKAVLGEAAYSFARVNFILVGCDQIQR